MSHQARQFILIAREELAAARLLAPALPRQAAFFVQQTAEKLLKAVLAAENIVFGKHHNLEALTGQLPDDNVMKADFGRLARFSPYATEHRYPSPRAGTPPRAPDPDDLLQGIEELDRLLGEIDVWLLKRPPHIPR